MYKAEKSWYEDNILYTALYNIESLYKSTFCNNQRQNPSINLSGRERYIGVNMQGDYSTGRGPLIFAVVLF